MRTCDSRSGRQEGRPFYGTEFITRGAGIVDGGASINVGFFNGGGVSRESSAVKLRASRVYVYTATLFSVRCA